jgi:hypothetical protein
VKLDFSTLPPLAQKSGVTGVTDATSGNDTGCNETPPQNPGVTWCNGPGRSLHLKHSEGDEVLHGQPGNGAGVTPVTPVILGKVEDGSARGICANDPDAFTALTATDEERAVRTWLERIGEADPDIVANVLALWTHDQAARVYFVNRAREDATHDKCGLGQ